MGKRKRIMSIIRTTKRIKAIELLAEQFEVGYQCAFEAYLIAKKYCEVFNPLNIGLKQYLFNFKQYYT